MNKELVESITDELVLLSLTKNVRTQELNDVFYISVQGQPFITIIEKEKRGKSVYMTRYKWNDFPALETTSIEKIVVQVQKWIEKETLKG